MDRKLQNQALQEIMTALEVIITSDKKGVADKTAKMLINKLERMGVKEKETEILLDWAKQRLIDNLSDDDEQGDSESDTQNGFED